MLPSAIALPDIEPERWNIVFYPSQTWRRRIAFGRFQHCWAFTYVPGFAAWLIYDPQWRRTRLLLTSHSESFTAALHGCTIVWMARRGQTVGLTDRFGFYCVAAIKHLLGLPCVAVTPAALYRALIRNGAKIISDGQPVRTPAAAAGSDAATGAGAGAG